MLILFELLAVSIITIPAFFSLLNPWFFSMHDSQHVARLYLLDIGIRQGYWFPRWVDTLGFNFGYPLFNFYPPLVYYIGEFFHFFGFSLAISVKLVFITGFILGAIGMYLLTKRHLGRAAGFLASVLYTYFFYHAVLIYVRGALAEFFTLAILPFIFLALDKLREELSLKNSFVFGILFAFLILNHPLVAVPFLFYLSFTVVFYLFITKKRVRLIGLLFLGVLVGLSLSAFFWLPSMLERKFTLVDSVLIRELADYKVHFVCLKQLLYSPWGFGGSIPGCFDGLTFQLGKLHLALIALSGLFAGLYMIRKKNVSENFEFFTYFLFLLLFSMFMTIENSKPVWDTFSYLWYLQFPWRFFTFTALFISMIGAFGLYYLGALLNSFRLPRKKIRVIQVGFLIITSILMIGVYQKYFKPISYTASDDATWTSFYEIADRVSRTSFEFVPKGVKVKKSELATTIFDIDRSAISQKRYEIVSGSALVNVEKDYFKEKTFTVNAKSPITLQLHVFNFPGWTVYLDGKRSEIDDSNPYKLITILVPGGAHVVSGRFEDTPVRTWATYISSFVLAVILLSLLRFKLKKIER